MYAAYAQPFWQACSRLKVIHTELLLDEHDIIIQC